MTGLEILGTGRCLPRRCVTNDDMARMVDTSDEWISTRTGIRQRYFCGEDEGVVSLSTGAARKALEKAGVSADQLGLILTATFTPDSFTPSVACQVHEALGCTAAFAEGGKQKQRGGGGMSAKMSPSAVLVIHALMKSKDMYCLRPKAIRFHKFLLLSIITIGLPAGIQSVMYNLSNMIIQTSLNDLGTSTMAAYTAFGKIDAIYWMISGAFSVAITTFIGQNYGAGKKERIWKSYLYSLAYAFGSGLILGVSMVFFGTSFLRLFTSDPAVIEAGMYRVTFMGVFFGFSAFMDCTIAASRAIGKSLVPTVIVLLGACVFRIVWIYTIFAYFRTVPSLYLLYIFSWSITACAEIIYFIRVYKKHISPLCSD